MLLLTSIASVLASVGIHFEFILIASAVSRWLSHSRLRVAIAVLVVLVAHLVEIAVFAAGWALLIATGDAQLAEPLPLTIATSDAQLLEVSRPFTDILYFSGTVYTSLGFGDIVPIGLCRLYAVLESVTGLVLIAWTASYTFGQMARNWRWFDAPRDRR